MSKKESACTRRGRKVPSVSVLHRHFRPSLRAFRRFNPCGPRWRGRVGWFNNAKLQRRRRPFERQLQELGGGASTISKEAAPYKTGGAARNYKRGQSPFPSLFVFPVMFLLFVYPASVRSVSRKLRNKQRTWNMVENRDWNRFTLWEIIQKGRNLGRVKLFRIRSIL